MKKCGVCKQKFNTVKEILIVGEKGGIRVVKLCRQCYEGFGKRIGKDELLSITVETKCDV